VGKDAQLTCDVALVIQKYYQQTTYLPKFENVDGLRRERCCDIHLILLFDGLFTFPRFTDVHVINTIFVCDRKIFLHLLST
jgi:hypothetical protein